jgi:hypothetical protein
MSNVEGSYSGYFKKIGQHAAHTPRKRWRCGSACAARAKPLNLEPLIVDLL